MKMDEQLYPRLCTGTFLTLLVGAKGQRRGSRNGDYKKSDGLANTDLFTDLMRLADSKFSIPESESDSFKTITSAIKNCRKDASEYFDPKIQLKKMEERLGSDEQLSVHKECEDFIEKYIDGGVKNRNLASALLWMIQNDPVLSVPKEIGRLMCTSIADAIESMHSGNTEKLSLVSLVQYVWLYILRHVPENSCGKETIKEWKAKYHNNDRDIIDVPYTPFDRLVERMV